MTSSLTGEGLDISRNVISLTSSGTDLDPNTDDLVNGMKVYTTHVFYSTFQDEMR